MSDQSYTWKVVDVKGTQLVIEYMSDGLPTMYMSAPSPNVDQTLEDIVAMYAPPTSLWLEKAKAKQEITIGATGSGTLPVVQAEPDTIVLPQPVVIQTTVL